MYLFVYCLFTDSINRIRDS